MNKVHDFYSSELATKSRALEIFKDEWVSRLPEQNVGSIPLFNDTRIKRLIEISGGVKDKKILELGPLEGGHFFMLSKAGATDITAVEANSRCYLKCLITKEMYDLHNVHLLYGNFIPYIENIDTKFDLTLALGVLYHLPDPVGALNHICRISNEIFIWTHYADMSVMPDTDPRYVAGIVKKEMHNQHGIIFNAYSRRYQGDVNNDPKFCGGVHETPVWIEKEIFIRILEINNFISKIIEDDPYHSNGPACTIYARRLGVV